jgi:hypothetical protein
MLMGDMLMVCAAHHLRLPWFIGAARLPLLVLRYDPIVVTLGFFNALLKLLIQRTLDSTSLQSGCSVPVNRRQRHRNFIPPHLRP